MDIAVNIDPDLQYAAKLPHAFLNHLLENGYQFDQGVLVLKLTGGFGSCHCCMTEFKAANLGCTIDIGYEINQYLNILTGDYVHVERVTGQAPYLIKIQGHQNSFGQIDNLKEQLEKLLVDIKVINTGMELTVVGADNTTEHFTIVELQDDNSGSMDWGLTVDTDVKVDFMETKEAIKDAERKELEKRGYLGDGHRLGGQNNGRSAWLNRIQSEIKKTTEL